MTSRLGAARVPAGTVLGAAAALLTGGSAWSAGSSLDAGSPASTTTRAEELSAAECPGGQSGLIVDSFADEAGERKRPVEQARRYLRAVHGDAAAALRHELAFADADRADVVVRNAAGERRAILHYVAKGVGWSLDSASECA